MISSSSPFPTLPSPPQTGFPERRATFAAAIESSHDGYWDWDLTTDLVDFSARCREMLGIDRLLTLETSSAWLDRVHLNDRKAVKNVILELRSGQKARLQCEHRVKHADGTFRWMMVRAAAICGNDGKPHRIVGWLSDVTDRKAIERQYAGLARRDGMTGLPNRLSLIDRLTEALELCHGSNASFALLVVDLNHFHRINARYGDVGGDEVLRTVGQVLRHSVRADDVVARIGGDKFGLLLLGEGLETAAESVGTRIHQALRRAYRLGDEDIYISATIGVVIGSTAYTRAGEVLLDADQALDEGKRIGGDRVVVFQPAMHHAPAAKLVRERDIRHAIERGEFSLHFQPMLGAPNGTITAFEALLRWQHPTEGVLAPAHFLDVLHETGLIIPVGRRVLSDACACAAEWRDKGHESVAVSVNVATSQLVHPGFVRDVMTALGESGLDPQLLMLEITEEALVGEAERTRDVLERLKKNGVRVYVDDFGTGYSSLSHLRELPVHGVKIDRGFLEGIHLPGAPREIVRTIVRLAHLLHLDVVAEGIETEEQMNIVRELQCDVAQGFWIARPLDPAQTDAFLRDHKPSLEALSGMA